MKWTDSNTSRMMNLISEQNKLSDGFAHAAKKLKCSKSAVANRYYKVMKKYTIPTSIHLDELYRMVNPPISCEAGSVNYINKPKVEKPKTFIEKVLAFFKGGKDE